MKVGLCLPLSQHGSTHGARMVCEEFITTLDREPDDLEYLLVVPKEFSLGSVSFRVLEVPEPESAWGMMRFEQFDLPRMLRDEGVEVLVMLYRAASLVSSLPVGLLEACVRHEAAPGIGGRLLTATRSAGAQGAIKHIVYSDQEKTISSSNRIQTAGPWVHPSFRALSEEQDRQFFSNYGLPPSYVLAHGISYGDIPAVLASWTWVDGSVGDSVPLVVASSDGSERQTWEREIDRLDLGHSVRVVTNINLKDLAALYRGAEVMLQGGQAVEHQLLRWAMACGVPVTAFDVPVTADTLGSAGYLVQPGDVRALGAACLTVIVEPEVRDRLRRDSLLRARVFHENPKPTDIIKSIVQDLVG